MPTVTPPEEALAAILSPNSVITSRVDIYEEDATTLWMGNAPLVDGSVSVDTARSERRHFEMSLRNEDGALDNYPGGFWYDKVIKPYRGVRYLTETESGFVETEWEAQLGEFLLDEIATDNFPLITRVKGRDQTIKLLEDELGQSTTFTAANSMETVIRALALNGGITKFLFPNTSNVLAKDYAFEGGTARWEAMTKIATAFSHELYFDGHGYLVLRPFRDPITSPVVVTFRTGPTAGNLAKFTKVANPSRLYNAVDVTGESTNQVPVFARAENRNPASPTSIENLGRRKVYKYKSAFLDSELQANTLAASFLAVYGLESFVINWESIVMFWLEGSDIVDFVDPNPNPGDPTRFLLGDFNIPLGLGTMSSTGRRVQVVS